MTKQPNADLIYIAASDKAPKELRDTITNALNALQRARVLTSTHRDTADKTARELDDVRAGVTKTGTTSLIDNKSRIDINALIAKIADKQHTADQARDAYKLAETIESKIQSHARRITIEHRAAIIQWIAKHRANDAGADGVVIPVQVREIHDTLGILWYPRHDQDLELSPLYHNGKFEWQVNSFINKGFTERGLQTFFIDPLLDWCRFCFNGNCHLFYEILNFLCFIV